VLLGLGFGYGVVMVGLDEIEPKPAVTDVPETELDWVELKPDLVGQIEMYCQLQREYVARAFGVIPQKE
jgi:hypothetical protein